jgi:hypothetical protein
MHIPFENPCGQHKSFTPTQQASPKWTKEQAGWLFGLLQPIRNSLLSTIIMVGAYF